MAKTINRAWHDANVLGSGAPLARRVEWHLAHQKACACRPLPKSVADEIALRHAAGKTLSGAKKAATKRTGLRRR